MTKSRQQNQAKVKTMDNKKHAKISSSLIDYLEKETDLAAHEQVAVLKTAADLISNSISADMTKQAIKNVLFPK